jgi:hypothetical protein
MSIEPVDPRPRRTWYVNVSAPRTTTFKVWAVTAEQAIKLAKEEAARTWSVPVPHIEIVEVGHWVSDQGDRYPAPSGYRSVPVPASRGGGL